MDPQPSLTQQENSRLRRSEKLRGWLGYGNEEREVIALSYAISGLYGNTFSACGTPGFRGMWRN